jgi:hypothetical protein
MEAGLEPFWFSSSMGCKEFILMKQVKGQRAYAAAANVSHPTNKG